MFTRVSLLSWLMFVVIGGVSTVGHADETGLVARWQLTADHTQEQRVQPTFGTWDATIAGPVVFDAESPNALSLDGNSRAGHRIVVADDVSQLGLPSEALTVEAWVNISEPREWGGMIGALQDNGNYEKGWLLGFRGSQFCFAVATEKSGRLNYMASPRNFEPDAWYYVVGTYDGQHQRLYVDGELVVESTESVGKIAYAPQGPMTIGAYHDDNEIYTLKGQLEQVSVWKRALSGKEIAEEFTSRKSRFPGIDAIRPVVADWPTYARDNQRTGVSEEELAFPLHLQWVHQPRHAPRPAWPAPANQDFWHKKFNLKARVVYDHAYHVVTVGDSVYFASSADDQVTCLDAVTGERRWRFFAEGPVRLAPTIENGRVLFGADDGYVYGLNAADGSLLWKHRLVDEDRRIPGNERVISVWPVRTGVLVDDGIAYFCAGLFPTQGVYQAAINPQTGEKLASAAVDVSAQGYLERRGGQLYAATGRDLAGAFVTKLARRGKGVGKETRRIPDDYPYAFIGTANARLGGGDGRLAAFDVTTGDQLWSADVEGKVHSLAVARGRLFAATDTGHIYCFAAAETSARQITPPPVQGIAYDDDAQRARVTRKAEQIVEQSGITRGYCLVLESGGGQLAAELAQRTDLQIVCVEEDAELVRRSRDMLDAAGLYGRVVVHHVSPTKKLPYTDYMFNLVISGGVVDDATYAGLREDAQRVTRPYGGVAILGPTEADVFRRGPLEGVGEWTHMYADAGNTVCSSDQHVGGRLRLQWFGPPGPAQMIDRHHRTIAPLYKEGRLFIPGDNRVIGADAYNGTPLWNVEVPNSRRIGIYRDCSYMVAGDGVVYVAADDRCLVLNAETGALERELKVPPTEQGQQGGQHEWGYLAAVDGRVIGSAAKHGAARRGHSLNAINEGTFWDFRPLVCSDSVFVTDPKTGKRLWTYEPPAGVIANPTFTVSDGTVFFVESANPETREMANGRVSPKDLLGKGSNLVALDLQSGSVLWSVPYDFSRIQHNIYISVSKGKVAVAGSLNNGTDRETAHVEYDVAVFDAKSGELAWKNTQQQSTKIGGDHGEQDHHPVIVGDKLYCEPFAYELHTGKPLDDFQWLNKHRRGCGTIAASATTFFFRNHNPTLFDLKRNEYTKVTTSTRPGCWINMIPAGGLLLIPEASSGCTCDFAVQTSLAFLPTPDEPVEPTEPASETK